VLGRPDDGGEKTGRAAADDEGLGFHGAKVVGWREKCG